MARQMSLFPARDRFKEKASLPEGELGALDEMFFASERFRSSLEYLELLGFMARFPRYSAFNCFLLYIQNPEISYVATAGIWKKRFKRKLKINARPLVILAPMSPVRFLYDVADTEGDPAPAALLKPGAAGDSLSKKVYERTIHNSRLHGIMVQEVAWGGQADESAVELTEASRGRYKDLALDPKAVFLVLLNADHRLEDKYSALVYELGRIFCGHRGVAEGGWWPERKNPAPLVKTLEAESVAYLVCRRCGLLKKAEKYVSAYREKERRLPALGLSSVLQATNYIEAMGRAEWKAPKKSN